MYILVDIMHTEFQYISLIEMQKYNWNRKKIEKRKTRKKKGHFVPVGNTNRDKRVCQPRGAGSTQPGQKVAICPSCQTRDKRTAWRSRLENRDNKGFPTGTN